jgi:Zn-dependent protease with chaperone function
VITALCAVLLCTAAYALTAPVIARRTPPALATRILVPTSLLVAAAATFALGVAAFTLVGQLPEIAEHGPWQPATLRAETPVPAAAAVIGGLLLGYATLSALLLVTRRSVTLVEVHRTCGRLGAPGSVVVLESPAPTAFTTPEASGRIIVTRGMLDALTPAERDAMLAHERSHLRHRHTWWLLAADLAAALNPTLRPTARALRHTVERWADEDAADTVGDRRAVAHALARAALAAHHHHLAGSPLPAATGGDVPARVTALLAPRRPRLRPALAAIAATAVLLGATAVASMSVQHAGERLFEQVMAAHPGNALHAGSGTTRPSH